ncbi:putative leucine-rich repeat receptor-like serine/threonine-protein kinase At2g19230 [Musa acuminata AAA Group]|uniref:putative leucine-rich repeat receptor-like serine/threonine-protein kinase At2g19230 n=1 Tax=Musa acuminata AAA Group TaxID=214697 RepID=UPI0031E2C10E
MATNLLPFVPPLLLLLLLLALSASASNFTSIDCGASGSYKDENGIAWETDESYVSNGENRVVQNPDSVPEPMRTLRVFSSRKKNCYPVSVPGGGRVLVRASFYYGNYDEKSSPPTFALQFDANSWETVAASMDQVVFHEAIYDVFAEGTAVCVAQLEQGQLPFVSAIEVRTLETDMYEGVDSSFALLLKGRLAFGAPGVVRYPSDAYDRIWDPVAASDELITTKSDTTVMDPTAVKDKPPAAVLLQAITTANVSTDVVLFLSELLPTDPVPAYINLYFAEMSHLGSKDNNTFQVYVDGDPLIDAVNPPYQSVAEYLIGLKAASASTNITLTATPEATVPPLISAMEVFVVRGGLSNGTDESDVGALIVLQQKFEVLGDWAGDPCLPAKYNADWVGCSSDPTPRITALYLSGYGLSGDLPDFSTLTALQTIDMSNNNITGRIPEFLGKLPDLKELNLADNKLSGAVPSSLTENKKIKLTICGNPSLSCSDQKPCDSSMGKPSTPRATKSSSTSLKKSRRNLVVVLEAVISLFLLVLMA